MKSTVHKSRHVSYIEISVLERSLIPFHKRLSTKFNNVFTSEKVTNLKYINLGMFSLAEKVLTLYIRTHFSGDAG